jgi:hypothetical protein
MKQFSLYDILGVLAPGALFTVGVIAFYPDAIKALPNKEFSLGDLGVLVIISYVIGNLVAALGNLLEVPYWKMMGGMPTEAARREKSPVITARQLSSVEARLQKIGFLKDEEKISQLSDVEWRALARQIYAFIHARGMTQRVDTFNAQYGMNRGIAAGLVGLIALCLVHSGLSLWRVQVTLLACTALAAYRMHRFSRHYAAEIFRQFLVSKDKVSEPQKPKDED